MSIYSSYLLLLAVLFPYSMSINPGKLGTAVDLNIKMFHSGSVLPIQEILSKTSGNSFTVLRERLDKVDPSWTNHDKTGLSILLSYDCSHQKCIDVKNSQECVDLRNGLQSDSLLKLVLRRTNANKGEWQLDCRKFLKVEIPEKDDGVPGARTVSGTERPSRTPSSGLGEENVGSGNKVEFDVDAVEAPAPVFKDEEDEPVTDSTTSDASDQVCTNTLFNHETQKFYDECCRKRSASVTSGDRRCDMDVIMAKLQALKDATSTTTTTTTTEAPADASDLERSGKSFDLDNEDENKTMNSMVYNKEAADVLFQEMSGELSGWKSKYYTCLGFFLVFFAFFLVTIAVLVFKLKKNKTVSPPASPGASLSVPQQRPRGYSAIDGDTETERAPLTPATEQAQAFQY